MGNRYQGPDWQVAWRGRHRRRSDRRRRSAGIRSAAGFLRSWPDGGRPARPAPGSVRPDAGGAGDRRGPGPGIERATVRQLRCAEAVVSGGPAVWRDMDQQALDDAYDQSKYAPNRTL